MQASLPSIESALNPEVQLHTDLPSTTMDVSLDFTQMKMVLSAVVANANDAIEEKGCIRISVGEEQLDEAFVKTHPGLAPGT